MRESVVIIGAGRSGRGMLGELYYKDKARITFADKDAGLTAGVRAARHGWRAFRF